MEPSCNFIFDVNNAVLGVTPSSICVPITPRYADSRKQTEFHKRTVKSTAMMTVALQSRFPQRKRADGSTHCYRAVARICVGHLNSHLTAWRSITKKWEAGYMWLKILFTLERQSWYIQNCNISGWIVATMWIQDVFGTQGVKAVQRPLIIHRSLPRVFLCNYLGFKILIAYAQNR